MTASSVTCPACGTTKEELACVQCGGDFDYSLTDDEAPFTEDCSLCEGSGTRMVCPRCYPESFDDES